MQIKHKNSKKILHNVGYHISSKELKGGNFLEDKMKEYGLGWAQFFLGNPRSYNLGEPTMERVKNSSLELNYVVHGPYIVNIVNSDKGFYKRSQACIIEALEACHQLGVDYYVTHLGSLEEKATKAEVVDRLVESCKYMLDELDSGVKTKLLLETSPGSKSGTKIGTLEELLEVVAVVASDNLGLCLDTEHAFANGLDLAELDLDKIGPEIDVVHLNSIPKDVELNSHRDKHGKTAIVDSREDIMESLARLIKYFDRVGVPLILERSGEEIIESDLQYLKAVLD